MDRSVAEAAFTSFLGQMRHRLRQATALADAAEACAAGGNVEKAVEVALDIEQISYEGMQLLNSASLLSRLSRDDCRKASRSPD